MVKAVLRHGAIEPISPLPDDWSEGQELIVEEASVQAAGEAAEDWDAWVQEMDELTSKISPEEYERLTAALAEADRRAKEYMRQKMGLP